MIAAGPATRVFVALEPVDMRMGYDGLHGLVAHRLGEDPRSGHLFVFTNTQRNQLEVIYLNGTVFSGGQPKRVVHRPSVRSVPQRWNDSIITPAGMRLSFLRQCGQG